MKLLGVRNAVAQRKLSGGSVLVEFAFIALAFYLLFAGTLEMGRLIAVSQAVQNAARVGARELALVPLSPTATFQEALNHPQVRERIYDERKLAVDVSTGEPDTDNWPVVNRMLLPVMIRSHVGANTTILHFPGAILQISQNVYTVAVPKVLSRGAEGEEVIEWHPVLEEVRSNPGDPNSGPFSLASTGPERGLVALRINCPYQASTLVAFRVDGDNDNNVIEAHDELVTAINAVPGAGTLVPITPSFSGDTSEAQGHLNDGGFNTGPYGLGNVYAMNVNGVSQAVRPLRRLVTSQSIFRREVFAQ